MSGLPPPNPRFSPNPRSLPDFRFSVVIPLYNKREWIRATLDSVLDQRLAPHEVIVVDDGSTDGGPDEIADLTKGQVRLVRQANAGPGPARNNGVAHATGDWIALIDADDRWHPDHLCRLAETIAAFPSADLVATTTRWQPVPAIDLALPELADRDPRLIDLFADTSLGEPHTSSVAIRREAFLAMDEGFGAFIPGEDVEFWIRFALDHTMARHPAATSIYVRGNGGFMESSAAAAAAASTERHPFELTINRVLADERHRARWPAIVDYADRAALIAARNMLYAGNGRATRRALDRLKAAPGLKARLLRVASYLPDRSLRAGAWGYTAMKRLMRGR